MTFAYNNPPSKFQVEKLLIVGSFLELIFRNILVWLVFFFSALFAFLAALFLPRHFFWERISQTWARASLFVLNIRVFIQNAPVPSTKPAIYIMNHESLIDIFTFCLVAPSNMVFVAKSSIGEVPILGRVMRRAGCVFINRSSRTEALGALNTGMENLP